MVFIIPIFTRQRENTFGIGIGAVLLRFLRLLGALRSFVIVVNQLALHREFREVFLQLLLGGTGRRSETRHARPEGAVCDVAEHEQSVGSEQLSAELAPDVCKLALEDGKVEAGAVVRNEADGRFVTVQEHLDHVHEVVVQVLLVKNFIAPNA